MLELSDQERKELEAMKNLWGREYNFRAELVLACSEPGLTTKEIAQKLSTSVSNVCKWRTIYKKYGIAGLEPLRDERVEATRVKVKTIEKRLMDMLEEHCEAPMTIEEVAKELKCSPKTITNILEKKGISMDAPRLWTVSGTDGMNAWNPPLLCIYLSPQCSFLITGTHPAEDAMEGVLKTQNPSLGAELSHSHSTYGLDDFLTLATRFSKEKRGMLGKDGEYERVAKEALAQWAYASGTEFYLFATGSFPDMEESIFNRYRFSSFPEMGEAFLAWMEERCDVLQFYGSKYLWTRISELAGAMEESSYPFVWMLQRQEEGKKAQAGAKLPVWHSVPEMLRELLCEEMKNTGEVKKESSGAQAGVLLYLVDEQGELHYRHLSLEERLKSLEDFDLTSKEGFERDLESLEEDTERFAGRIKRESLSLYLDAVRKQEGKKSRKAKKRQGKAKV